MKRAWDKDWKRSCLWPCSVGMNGMGSLGWENFVALGLSRLYKDARLESDSDLQKQGEFNCRVILGLQSLGYFSPTS
eukprot:3179555-Amphidinium_carterae.2